MAASLRIGAVVHVKQEAEILATLDEHGMYEGLPFTGEMRSFCGNSYKVLKIANRIHIDGMGVRGIGEIVILDGARCDGSLHGGCGRACHLLFKRAWLDLPGQPHPAPNVSQIGGAFLGEPSFWKPGVQPCQGNGIPLVQATRPLSPRNLRQYIQDLKSGTWKPRDLVCILLFLLNRKWDTTQPIWGLSQGKRSWGDLVRISFIVLGQTARWHLDRIWRTRLGKAKAAPVVKPQGPLSEPLHLRPGEWVEVKSREGIQTTLDSREKHRGLGFCGSMLRDCGQRFRVLRPVHSIVDERTGRQVTGIKNTVLLEGSVCSGISYRGCPRLCYWLWREDWLKRVEGSEGEAHAIDNGRWKP